MTAVIALRLSAVSHWPILAEGTTMGGIQPIDPYTEARAQVLARLRALCDHMEMYPEDGDWTPHEAHIAIMSYLMRIGDCELAELLAFFASLVCLRCTTPTLHLAEQTSA